MKARYVPATFTANDPITTRLQGIVLRILRLVGVRGIGLVKTTVNDVDRYSVDSIEFFDGVPSMLSSTVKAYQDVLAGLMALAAVMRVSIELDGNETAESEKIWNGEDPRVYRSDEKVEVIDEETEARAVELAARKREESEAIRRNPPSASDVVVGRVADEAKIQLVYEAVAEMLPVEGRDYLLNPSVKESGAVGFTPVALTAIGKIWLDYLSSNLGRYLKEKAERSGASHGASGM